MPIAKQLKLANEQYDKAEYKKAIQTLSSYIEAHPNDLEAVFSRAFIYVKIKEYKAARQDYYYVYDSDEKNEYPVAFFLGQVEEALKRTSEAELWYKEAIKHPVTRRSGREALDELKAKLNEEEISEEGQIKHLKPTKPKTTLANVIGNEDLKQYLKKYIVLPIQHPELTKKYGLKGSLNLLLYGPPGSGKTFTAEAIAGEANTYFLLGRIQTIQNKWVGDTSKNIHALFEQAREHKPCIIFIDEIDALASKRNTSSDTVGEGSALKSATNQFLTELDGSDTDNSGVYVISATNRPYDLDPAILRSGRFGEIKYIGLPTRNTLKELYKYYLKGKRTSNINYGRLARCTSDYTPADIKVICERAIHEFGVVNEYITGKEHIITTHDIISYIKAHHRKSSIGEWYSETYKEIIGSGHIEWVDNKQHITTKSGKFSSIEKEYYKEMVQDVTKQSARGAYLSEKLGKLIALNLF